MNDELIETFLAEAHELIVDLEKALLQLESDPANSEAISATFRAMHTLKGSAAMFGFQSVSEITHDIESIYQDIRDGRRNLDQQVLTITFQTLDHLRVALQQQIHTDPEFVSHHAALLSAIKGLLTSQNDLSAQDIPKALNGVCTYYINFEPHKNILKNGTNPLYLVDDLLVLGHGVCHPYIYELPDLASIEPDACYMGFELLLATDKSVPEIQSVFLFVEEQCKVEIIKLGESDKLRDISQTELPWNNRQDLLPVGVDAIQAFIKRTGVKQKLQKAVGTQSRGQKANNVRVSADQLDDLMNLVSELVTTQARLALFSNEHNSSELGSISENIEKITRRLRDNAFTMSLVPLDTIVVRFQRLINDLSKDLHKPIEFKAEGMDTKIDKSIIEKLTDPLLHIIRNSVDHGIERTETRITSGKSAKGTVLLKSYYSGANVLIEIHDDGGGIDLERVRQKAINKGLIDPQTSLTEQELIDLIFLPGFSTAAKVTDVSGRGVGMDVVRRNISDIRGEVLVRTKRNEGTVFTIKLPLTLSILDGILVKVGGTHFVLPLTSVAKCYEVETSQMESTYNQWITLEGKRTPFIYLRREFGVADQAPHLSQIINVPYNGTYVGLAVDRIEGEYQAVLKPLGYYYQQQQEFSGATILGNGTVALVLDANKLINKLTIEK